MNCKIIHSEEEICFSFDYHKDTNTRTFVTFDKRTKRFHIANTKEWCGVGFTLTVKQFKYCVKYLEKDGFL